MKEITLTISERVPLIKILNDFKGNLSTLSLVLEDIKKVAITPAEWEKAGLVKNDAGEGKETWLWKDEEDTFKTVEFNQEVIDFVLESIKSKEDSKEITLADIALISLKDKLLK